MSEALWKEAKILIVDDEPANLLLLERVLEIAGLCECRNVTDSRLAMAAFDEFQPDIVMLDLSMPYLDGFDLLRLLGESIAKDRYLPIIVLTADATDGSKQKALSSGAHDFVTKPFNAAEVILRVRNLLHTRHLQLQLQRHNESLESVVGERTTELREAVTKLQTAQQQMIQQERLRALGTMASGVAHDFNNALSIIMGFGEFVLRDCQNFPEMEDAAEKMRLVLTAADDASKIVSRLRDFNRPPDGEVRRSIDLTSIVDQALSFTKPRWATQAMGRGITIRPQLDLQKIPPISGDPAELREGLTNMIFNAVDAMPNGGVLSFRTRAEPGWVILEIGDTGSGMPEDVRQRCLEPFFTTKGERGTGLGLAMVYGIVQRHHGEMEIQSAPGAGTTFIFRFPASTTPLNGAEAIVTLSEAPLRILVVDDQEILREILAEYLVADLHIVETASGGAEALDQIKKVDFELLITDQAMPGMNGDQLALEIKRTHPHIATILLTGFGAHEGDALPDGVDLVVGKPVTQRVLRQAISRVIRPTREFVA